MSVLPERRHGERSASVERSRRRLHLFVGTLEPRKNIGALLDAYTLLLARRPGVARLVLARRATAAPADWLARLDRAPLAGRVTTPRLRSDAERDRCIDPRGCW